jgi:hypothetical protein
MSPAARGALAEFGALHIQQNGAGAEVAREDIRIDPTLALHEDDRFREFEPYVGTLFPLGEIWNGMAYLAIAADGRVYGVMGDVECLGQAMEGALETLIRGLKTTPIPTDSE